MATNCKLFYFHAAGRAEPIRWIFAYSGQEFDDVRLKQADKANWISMELNSPFGCLPFLEQDGKILGGCLAIARYVARKLNLVGKDEWESAQADAIADYVWDVLDQFLEKIRWEKDIVKQSELKKKFQTEDLPRHLAILGRHLQANRNGTSFMIGEAVTWADFVVVLLLDLVGPESVTNYPLLREYATRVHELTGIKEWLETYPVSNRGYVQIQS